MSVMSSEARSRIMRAIKAKNTSPEMAVRRRLHAEGYRFRLHPAHLPGKPDIVLPRYKAAIFVHGCFWHQHPDPACRNAQLPKSNVDYWGPKLARNVERDAQAKEALEKQGWRVLALWECEIKSVAFAKLLLKFLRPLKGSDRAK